MIDPEFERNLRTAFARWNEGERVFDPQWTHPDVEIHGPVVRLDGRVYRGQEGVTAWIAEISEAFDEWQLELDELDEFAPGRVLVIGKVHMRGRGSGVTVDEPCAWIFDHVDGMITRFEPFLNRVDEARAIAGR